MATTIETELKEVLDKIDSRLERIEGDITESKVSQSCTEGELGTLELEVSIIKDDLKDLKGS